MLKGILSISGQPGLFKMVAEAKNRVIVESLTTGKRIPVGQTAKISSLEDIAIYTTGSDLPLSKVLQRVYAHEKGAAAINAKADDKALKRYFGEVISEYDQDRVYTSDIKKIILWYNILHEKGMLNFEDQENPETALQDDSTSEQS